MTSFFKGLSGAYHRKRRALRARMLEPLLVGSPTLRDTVMTALSARGHTVLCDLGDVRFHVDPGDRVVGAWLMWHGGWQRQEIEHCIEMLGERIGEGSVFVDVGANIGTHTVYAMRTGRFARAVAFEPEPRNARLLRMNLDANALAEATVVIDAAAGDAAGVATLHLHPRNKGGHAIGTAPSDDGLERLDVPLVRVEDELRRLAIAPADVGLVWMDVEGYEPQAVAGLGAVLGRPLAFEFSPARYGAAGKRRLIDLLAAHYTTVLRLPGPARGDTSFASLAGLDDTCDLVVF
jgi:FkbM family methyltransferase